MKLACLLLCSAALAAQTLEGSLYNSITGAPVTGAYVYLTGVPDMPNNQANARSDASGHFSLLAPPTAPGSDKPYISAERSGYLSAGVRLNRLDPSNPRIPLTPEAFISGKLVDQEGFPVQGADVRAAYYVVTITGERVLQYSGGRVVSDDLGQFRLRNLRAGHYYILVESNNLTQWDGRYTGQFFPGGSQPDEAHVIQLAAGQERSLGELTVKQLESVNVSGRAVVPSSSQATQESWRVELQPSDSNPVQQALRPLSQNRADGSFLFAHVLPGSYTLVAQTGKDAAAGDGDFESTRQIEVGTSDVTVGVLTLQQLHAVDLTGTVVMTDGSTPGPVSVSLRSERRPAGGLPLISTLSKPDGTFSFRGLLPGHYTFNSLPAVQTSPLPPTARSAKMGDREVLQSGFDVDGSPMRPMRITLSAQPITARGRLLDVNGKPLANAAIEFAANRPSSQALVHTDLQGWFSAQVYMPGAYHILAVADGRQENLLYDWDYLAAHAKDFPLTQITENQSEPLVLTMPAGN